MRSDDSRRAAWWSRPHTRKVNTFNSAAPALAGPRIMQQDWNRISFVHWAVEPDLVAPLLPPLTRPDVLDGVT